MSPTIFQISRTPRHWTFTKHPRTTRPSASSPDSKYDDESNHMNVMHDFLYRQLKFYKLNSIDSQRPAFYITCNIHIFNFIDLFIIIPLLFLFFFFFFFFVVVVGGVV